MQLTSLYIEILHERLWKSVTSELLVEASPGLKTLLQLADEHVFKPMGIAPTDNVYFIAGSARIYLQPDIIASFKIDRKIGDLDIVIPGQEYWANAGKEAEYDAGAWEFEVNGKELSVFTKWDPRKSDELVRDYDVASTSDILNRADLVDGHWFMDFADIADYKMRLNREKEQQFVGLYTSYMNSSPMKRGMVLRKIVNAIGLDSARQFLDMTKLGKQQSVAMQK